MRAAAALAAEVWDFNREWGFGSFSPRPIPPVFEERHPMRREEEREMEDAIAAGNMEEAVLEAADLLWVVLGDLETFGEAGYEAVDAVARKNAAKTIHTHSIAPSGKLLPLDDAHRHKWAGMEEARARARERRGYYA